uniref:Uncharacterized protein n=1 Tax=Marseillevirus LCMAC102 TaxID=2506603 RepID=A0A481YUU7_9VIRU|nr:MAG: hypothetical protein LCMAC102_03600 [Marseillevirus LCMAC102]
MELYDWIENHRSKHLTIKDLKKWKKGEIKDVVIFDRNFEESHIWNLQKNKKYDANEIMIK